MTPIACLRRRRLLLAAAAAACVPAARAAAWPERPLRLVVPYAPGAAADALARQVAERLAAALGQPVIVENRAGAGGTLGADNVAKAAPDGYSLLLGTDATHATNHLLAKRFPYDPVKSFTPLVPAAVNHIVLAAHPAQPYRTVPDLIAYAKAHPKALSFGSSGTGSAHHLAGELLSELAGIELVHVPYKGGGQAVTDALGGNLPLVFASMATARPHLESGKLRPLGMVEAQRYAALPQLPTIGETVSGYAIQSWFAFFAPAGLPPAIAKRLVTELNKVLEQAALRELMDRSGLTLTGGSPEALAVFVQVEIAQRTRLVKAAGIEPE